MQLPFLIKEPDKKAKSLVRKLTHSGETDLDKQTLGELKSICKAIEDDNLIVIIYKECIKCLEKEHSQVRVTTLKLIDYLFQKSHIFRLKLLDNFDKFLELTLCISHKPKVKLVLPPPKKFAVLLQELAAKLINTWHSDFGAGYEKLRYAYRYLNEHKLVDFSQYRVQTQEELIRRQKLAENQEKILSRSIENRLKELNELKPEVEQLLVQIESALEILVPNSDISIDSSDDDERKELSIREIELLNKTAKQRHGIGNLSQSIAIAFNPFYEVLKNQDNKDIVQNLRELKKELIEIKLTRLICIEKTLSKRSAQFVSTLKEIIDIKAKCTNIVLKLGELKIINDTNKESKIKGKKLSTLDNVDSDSDDSCEFEEVEPKEGLESYIPKSMRFEYGLEAINPKELDDTRKVNLTNEIFELKPSCSGIANSLNLICNVKLESGKLCPRRDKIKCPFHGKIIARDLNGVPISDEERLKEEELSKTKSKIPEWQDPELLADIKAAIGIDLTMPKKGRVIIKQPKLANTKTCDLTPKQRLQKRLKTLNK